MYETLQRTLVGVAPILMHNSRLNNPLHPITKMLKPITGKRKKTDADLQLMSDLEWLGSTYTTEDIDVSVRGYEVAVQCKGRLCIPGDLIMAMLVNAGAKVRKRMQFIAGVLVDGDFPLEYSGQQALPELFTKVGYRDVRRVRVGAAGVMRTRPIIRSWRLPFELKYLPSLLNAAEVDEALILGGIMVGICDYRPRYGRFTVEAWKA